MGDQKKGKSGHSVWRSGDFDRSRIPEVFHRFVPAHATDSLPSIDLDRLWSNGKRLILLDVDHTIVKWRAEDFSPDVIAWIERAKRMGFELCIISNTRRVERLKRLIVTLNGYLHMEAEGAAGVQAVRGRFKPSRAMFRLALIKFKRRPEEAVMIGDQLMTDILGANRAGIDAIWVRKMEGREFVGTRMVNRVMERLLQSQIYRALVNPADEEAGLPSESNEGAVLRQIVRFGIVGGTSFIIDAGLTFLFMRGITVHGAALSIVLGDWLRTSMPGLFSFAKNAAGASAPILGGAASFIAMFNSFVLNRAWTFEQRGKAERLTHLHRFYTVSIIGAVLNALIFSAFFNVIPGHPNRSILIAKILSALIVAVWNFLGQRYYAFRPVRRRP